MKIQQLYIHDSVSDITIKDISFSRLNVLVGLSGAGKTTIISALKKLVSIAEGVPTRGLEWRLTFSDDNERTIEWHGKISRNWEFTDDGLIGNFVKEKLIVDNELLIDSSESDALFNGFKLPKLDASRSLIFHLKNDNAIKDIYTSLVSCIIVDV
ncbi:hypothetical protein D8T43_12155, partial [Vibrio vulnificus]